MADTFKGIITADGKKRQLPYGNVVETPTSDKTLSVQGGFADAKTVGDSLKQKANGAGITLSINEAGGLRVTYDDGK